MPEPRASDFEIGELVRFKSAEDQPMGGYEDFYGHLCLVLAIVTGVNHCVTVRTLATGETATCWVTRIEKFEGQQP